MRSRSSICSCEKLWETGNAEEIVIKVCAVPGDFLDRYTVQDKESLIASELKRIDILAALKD